MSAGAADCGGCDGKETSLHSHPLHLLLHLLVLHLLLLLRVPFAIQSEALGATLATRVVKEGGGGRGWGVPGGGDGGYSGDGVDEVGVDRDGGCGGRIQEQIFSLKLTLCCLCRICGQGRFSLQRDRIVACPTTVG